MDDLFCENCGGRPFGDSCCWFSESDDDQSCQPHRLIPGKDWEEWDADQQFLITVMMEQFGGAAEEWELLCRLPWPRWRMERCVCVPWGPWSTSAWDHPCIRQTEERGTRYFLCDMARAAYTSHRWQIRQVASLLGDSLEAGDTDDLTPPEGRRREARRLSRTPRKKL